MKSKIRKKGVFKDIQQNPEALDNLRNRINKVGGVSVLFKNCGSEITSVQTIRNYLKPQTGLKKTEMAILQTLQKLESQGK